MRSLPQDLAPSHRGVRYCNDGFIHLANICGWLAICQTLCWAHTAVNKLAKAPALMEAECGGQPWRCPPVTPRVPVFATLGSSLPKEPNEEWPV